jgi:hypothetical protein
LALFDDRKNWVGYKHFQLSGRAEGYYGRYNYEFTQFLNVMTNWPPDGFAPTHTHKVELSSKLTF